VVRCDAERCFLLKKSCLLWFLERPFLWAVYAPLLSLLVLRPFSPLSRPAGLQGPSLRLRLVTVRRKVPVIVSVDFRIFTLFFLTVSQYLFAVEQIFYFLLLATAPGIFLHRHKVERQKRSTATLNIRIFYKVRSFPFFLCLARGSPPFPFVQLPASCHTSGERKSGIRPSFSLGRSRPHSFGARFRDLFGDSALFDKG